MLISMAAALSLPSELLIFSYAVLGPLHYLTQISWLYDRKFFTTGQYDWIFLVIPALPLTMLLGGSLLSNDTWVVLLIGATFGAALGMAFFESISSKILITVLTLVVLRLVTQYFPGLSFVVLFLPTILHVFLFTGLFILVGAIKSRSFSAYLSLVVFLFCAAVALFLPTADTQANLISAVEYAIVPFVSLNYELSKLFGIGDGTALSTAVTRFLAYAYTYHYLNWFSKTKVIGWHEISRARTALIIILWVLAVGLYAYDYLIGFVLLYSLSLVHVFLEFPLNHKAISTVFQQVLSQRFRDNRI